MTGRRDGPQKTGGGVCAYELISAAIDPGHPAHGDAVAEFSDIYGGPADLVRPYTWLLDRVGDDGIKLTGAGYLPPVHVESGRYRSWPRR